MAAYKYGVASRIPEARMPIKTVAEKRSEIIALSRHAVIFPYQEEGILRLVLPQLISAFVSFVARFRCSQRRRRPNHSMPSQTRREPASSFACYWLPPKVLQTRPKQGWPKSDATDQIKQPQCR